MTISDTLAPVAKAIDIKTESLGFFAFEISVSACSEVKVLGWVFSGICSITRVSAKSA